MTSWFEWLSLNWINVLIPILAFLAAYVVGIWVRNLLYRFFARWEGWTKWRGRKTVAETMRRPVLDWFLLLGAYIAVQISILPPDLKALASRIIAVFFIIYLAWIAISIAEKIIKLYATGDKTPKRSIAVAVNAARVTIIIIAILIILSIWGVPINPILLVIAVVLFVAGLALRDAIPSYLFGMQMTTGRQLKVGDFIKLDSGESGQIASITWQNTEIKSIQGNTIIIPNSKLARATVVNYGRPLKKAANPFHFYTRLHLRELTGQKACNLNELAAILKDAPDAVVYYHVHRFLEEQLYLTPEPANDFAIWINNVLGNDILGEKLASIDTFAFPSTGAVKQRLVDTIEDYLRNYPDGRRCPEGEEFHFIRSISFILPTPYVAHDLRDFVEILRKVTIDSIYFHIYEARLRLQKGTNDFSIWIADSLGEKDLANTIANIDPYVYTLDSLRNRIIQQVENHIR